MSNLETQTSKENLDADFESDVSVAEQEKTSEHFERAIDDNQMLLTSLEAHVAKNFDVTLEIPDFGKEKDNVIAERDLEVSEL